MIYGSWGKRMLDVVVVLIMAPVVLAVCTIVAVGVGLSLGWPVLYSQPRPGLGGRPFRLYKFRTMTSARDAKGRLLADAERLTPFGKVLRASSIDELPELWNVLVGEMSLVGPRPLLMQYLPLYTLAQRRRHEVRPGITGWAQVNGRNAISWEQKFEYDVWYVDHQSFLLDLRILWVTVVRVVQRSGISPPGAETMPEFQGSRDRGSDA